MHEITVRDVLLYLEREGWSDLIDSRWRDKVVQDIQNEFPDISGEVLENVLKLVLI